MVGAEGAQLGAEHAGGLLGGQELAGGEAHEAALFQPQSGHHRVLHGLDKLGDAAHNLAVLVVAEPVGLFAGLDLHVGAQLVDLLAGALEAGDHHRLDGVPLKGAEAAGAQGLSGVGDGQINAQIRLVGAVLVHGLPVGDAAEGGGGGHVVGAVLGKDGGQHVLQHGEHVLLIGKGHLHVQLVELAGGAVTPGVLVPEAGGNLEVLVEAGGHQKLLELLGGLGQGVELAGVLAAGHQVVPGALRGGGREDGGGDLQEAVVKRGLPQGGHHLAAEDDVVLHLRVAEIQIAVLQAGGLVGLPAAVDLEGQLVVAAAAQHLHRLRHHLDVAGGQLGILGVPLPHHTGDLDGGLLVQPLEGLPHGLVLHDHLGHAVEVPQDGEGKVLAHLADVLQKARQGDGLAHVLHAELPAGVGAVMGMGCLHQKSTPNRNIRKIKYNQDRKESHIGRLERPKGRPYRKGGV
ncbi:Uncharacterised protein [Flavonifractor plautii]|uniref:Uncharacterized protein n=1 Tax=Flavonifractor plautii TaxID=292800 RepID=A0A174FHF8_FLAPL|nr:Uncharacterised protein [Flavonifractor plautii]